MGACKKKLEFANRRFSKGGGVGSKRRMKWMDGDECCLTHESTTGGHPKRCSVPCVLPGLEWLTDKASLILWRLSRNQHFNLWRPHAWRGYDTLRKADTQLRQWRLHPMNAWTQVTHAALGVRSLCFSPFPWGPDLSNVKSSQRSVT